MRRLGLRFGLVAIAIGATVLGIAVAAKWRSSGLDTVVGIGIPGLMVVGLILIFSGSRPIRETRRSRTIAGRVAMAGGIADALVASAVLITQRSTFGLIVGSMMLVGGIVIVASSIVLLRTADRLPD